MCLRCCYYTTIPTLRLSLYMYMYLNIRMTVHDQQLSSVIMTCPTQDVRMQWTNVMFHSKYLC